MDKIKLFEPLDILKKKLSIQLLSSLEERKLKELVFHNEYRNMEQGKPKIRKETFDLVFFQLFA